MSEKKYCPMSFEVNFQCQKEKCAWWSKSTEDCAILMIGNYIATGWLLLDEAFYKKGVGARQAKKKGGKS